MISIVIPVYNVEKYLRECLDSIINQTFKDLEIICVNDGSPDNSLSILQEYAAKDSRVVIISKENGGYASAINTGIDVAQGEFIQIVESDDFCDINMCKDMYEKIKDSDADFITADFYTLRPILFGNKLKQFRYFKSENEIYTLKDFPEVTATTVKIGERGMQNITVVVELVDVSERNISDKKLVQHMLPKLSEIPDVEIQIRAGEARSAGVCAD